MTIWIVRGDLEGGGGEDALIFLLGIMAVVEAFESPLAARFRLAIFYVVFVLCLLFGWSFQEKYWGSK